MTRRGPRFVGVLLLAAAVAAGGAGAAEPLLAWTDAPPAIEVRPLSGRITVGVRYGAIDPATFHAELDGEPVTVLFAPAAGAEETVALPFIAGRNRLVLMASSPDGLEHDTLERRITFARLPGDEHAAERLRSLPELKHEMWLKRMPVAAPAPASAAPASAPASAAPATPPASAPASTPPAAGG